ncbi:hypothetical protein B0H17DRAFT_927172, partial [Mycena rosella]
QKCVFLGYPQPGWLFWHPETKKTIISDRTDFDERYFPGNTTKITNAVPLSYPVPSVYASLDEDDTSDQGGEERAVDPATHLNDPPCTPRPESSFATSSLWTTPPDTPQAQPTIHCPYQ